jgi:thiamine-monophosphate kinase
MTAIPLGDGAEFDRIREIAATLGAAAGPLGDDTAPIPSGRGTLVVSTDVAVEGVHFRREWLTPIEIGWRATASALSDLAAAAAAPAGITVAVVLPPSWPEETLPALMAGVGEAALASGCRVLGGDLSSGPALMVAVTVFGHADPAPLSRVGARPGDGVYVTGALGGARAALLDWLDGRVPSTAARLAFARPQPRLAAARWLATQGATAMMDISDGLGGDARHLAAASGVRLELELERLPIHPSVHAVARRAGTGFRQFAATGGEDYELLVTLPAAFTAERECEPAAGVSLTRIGRVVAGSGVLATLDGEPVELSGFRHVV